MTEKKIKASRKKAEIKAACRTGAGKAAGAAVVIIKPGEVCPNCGFARLASEPGGIVRCPVCGYGNGAGHT